MTTSTDVARHPFLTSPGEPLEIAPDPVEAAIRFGAFTEATGIPAPWVLTSFLAAIPLPIYPAQWPEGRKRWDGVKADMMWHPLMWLPKRVANRYPITDDDGQSVVEDDDTWAVRMCWELAASGMYDQDTGTWADVLATVGLSVDNPADLGRIEEWLDGADDPVLDGLDTTSHYENADDPDWAIHVAMDRLEGLRLVSWALAAEALFDALNDLSDMASDPELQAAKAIWTAKLLADLANSVFTSIPLNFPGHGDEAAWWARNAEKMATFTGTTNDVLAGPVDVMADRLILLSATLDPMVDEMVGAEEDKPQLPAAV